MPPFSSSFSGCALHHTSLLPSFPGLPNQNLAFARSRAVPPGAAASRARIDLMHYEKQRQETLKDLGADPYVD
jgi:hypothetical protein